MTLVRPYCTIADVQQECGNSDPAENTWYRDCINQASRYVEEVCGRDFWYHDYSGETTGEGENAVTAPFYSVPRADVIGDQIFLPFPIITLSSLWVYADRTAEPTEADLWLPSEYTWENGKLGRAIITSEDGPFGEHPFRGAVRLAGYFGFLLSAENPDSTPPIFLPASIRRATWLIASAISGNRSVEEIGLDGSKVSLLEKSIPKEALTLLAPFKTPSDTTF